MEPRQQWLVVTDLPSKFKTQQQNTTFLPLPVVSLVHRWGFNLTLVKSQFLSDLRHNTPPVRLNWLATLPRYFFKYFCLLQYSNTTDPEVSFLSLSVCRRKRVDRECFEFYKETLLKKAERCRLVQLDWWGQTFTAHFPSEEREYWRKIWLVSKKGIHSLVRFKLWG